jgi:hypothetical protein
LEGAGQHDCTGMGLGDWHDYGTDYGTDYYYHCTVLYCTAQYSTVPTTDWVSSRLAAVARIGLCGVGNETAKARLRGDAGHGTTTWVLCQVRREGSHYVEVLVNCAVPSRVTLGRSKRTRGHAFGLTAGTRRSREKPGKQKSDGVPITGRCRRG